MIKPEKIIKNILGEKKQNKRKVRQDKVEYIPKKYPFFHLHEKDIIKSYKFLRFGKIKIINKEFYIVENQYTASKHKNYDEALKEYEDRLADEKYWEKEHKKKRLKQSNEWWHVEFDDGQTIEFPAEMAETRDQAMKVAREEKKQLPGIYAHHLGRIVKTYKKRC